MGDNAPAADLVPKIFRFSDIDQFRSSVRTLEVDFTPLVRTIAAEQTILNLQGFDINLTKSFPRIVDARLKPNCTAVAFSMDDGVPIRFNGVERDQSTIVIGNNGAEYSSVERTERQYASIMFTPPIEGRGWPETNTSFKVFEISLVAQHRLRLLVSQVLSSAPNVTHRFDVREASLAIRESLLAAIDLVFADMVPARWATRANAHRQFRIFRDVRAILDANLATPIYSAELAKQLGVSVRTLHDAILRYRGMSLHRYLRLRRLWLVRKRLLSGTSSVKGSALAFGFWHMGDFSHSYRQQFGESVSETLERANRR